MKKSLDGKDNVDIILLIIHDFLGYLNLNTYDLNYKFLFKAPPDDETANNKDLRQFLSKLGSVFYTKY